MSSIKQLSLAVLAALIAVQAAAQEPILAARTIAVSGTATVSVKPDFAIIQIGAFFKSPSAVLSKKRCDASMAKAVAAIRKLGVKPGDIETTQYSVIPLRAKEEDPTVWKVVEGATVKVRDLSLVAAAIDAAVANGAPYVSYVSFGLDAAGPARDKVRAMAVKAAADKAASLAQALGVELGDVKSVAEGGDYGYRNQVMMNWDGNAAVAAGEGMRGEINPGEQSVSLTVNVVYAIK